MTNKHTPAPCPFCGSIAALEIQHSNYPGDRKVICNFNNGGCGASTESGGSDIKAIKNWNKRANAKLIAAAPDLLEALIGMMNVTVMSKNGELEKARVAIAKATCG